MRFGVPRSCSPSPERGTPSKSKAKGKIKASAATPEGTTIFYSPFNDRLPTPRTLFSPQAARKYRRGRSFGLRASDEESSSSSSSSSESSNDEGGFTRIPEYSSDSGTGSGDDDEDEEFSFTASFRSSQGPSEFPVLSVASAKGKGKEKEKEQVPLSISGIRANTPAKSPQTQRETEETVASIRMRTRFQDPYEEWEKDTHRQAFRSARKTLSTTQSELIATQSALMSKTQAVLKKTHDMELEAVQSQLRKMRIQHEQEEQRLRKELEERDKALWARIERAIGIEEEKVRKELEKQRIEQENKRKEAEAREKARQAEELKKKLEKEKKEAEEKAKRDQEEKKRKEEEAEEQEARKIAEAARLLEEQAAADKEKAGSDVKKAKVLFGRRTPQEEWTQARGSILELKDSILREVKANKETKKNWNSIRRQITPKVGQLTNDKQSIDKISQQLYNLLIPQPPHSPQVYVALCSSLSKAIILQAETEVTAEKKAAGPLAHVAYNLLATLGELNGAFREIFWAKLVQRTGGWVIPTYVSSADVDGRAWGHGPKERGRGRSLGEDANDEKKRAQLERMSMMGFRRSERGDGIESPAEHALRLSGLLRVYWEIVKVGLTERGLPPFKDGVGMGQRTDQKELEAQMQGLNGAMPFVQGPQSPYTPQRFWLWFARMSAVRPFLESGVGAELVHTALEVMGAEAADIWGHQWIKMLELLYEGATKGLYPERAAAGVGGGGEENVCIGGKSPEGRAARARVQMEIERIVKGTRKVVG